ncbi:MAG: metal ABC transporter permease, partial [Negativicutes bacterium]|nr:metal ABC transporter permease [Negativicutes bacterium]
MCIRDRLAVVVGFFALAGNRLLLISVNPTLAASRRVRVWLWEGMLAAVLAAVVALSIRWVGILVINSLLVLPAATARNRATSYRRQYWLAVAVALISGVGGLILSYYWDTATGATVVLVNAVLFGLSVIRTG